MENHKKCSICSEILPVSRFAPRKSGKFGVRGQCKKCFAARQKSHMTEDRKILRSSYDHKYYLLHKEKYLARARATFAAHREDKATYIKEYYQKNKSRIDAQKQTYYEKNKETFAAYFKHHSLTKRDIILSKVKAYRQTPGAKANKKALYHKRRTRTQFAFHYSATKSDFLSWMKDGAICYLTGVRLLPGQITLDHVVPLYYGGTHDVWNIQPASHAANSTKNTKIVYFDISTREPRFTLDPCPGGIGPNGETWPRIPLVQPTLDEMESMIAASRERRLKVAA